MSAGGSGSAESPECEKCAKLSERSLKLQTELNELRITVDAMHEESENARRAWEGEREAFGREKQAWAEEKATMEKKREKSLQALRAELERASTLLREEAEAFNHRLKDLKANFESESAREAAKYRADLEEVRRSHDRQMADMHARLADSDAERSFEFEKLKCELAGSQGASRALQHVCDERSKELISLRIAFDDLAREREHSRVMGDTSSVISSASCPKCEKDSSFESASPTSEEMKRLRDEIRALREAREEGEHARVVALAQIGSLQNQLKIALSQQAEHTRALEIVHLAQERALSEQAKSLASRYEAQIQRLTAERDALLEDERHHSPIVQSTSWCSPFASLCGWCL